METTVYVDELWHMAGLFPGYRLAGLCAEPGQPGNRIATTTSSRFQKVAATPRATSNCFVKLATVPKVI